MDTKAHEMPTHIVAGAGIVENDRGEILLVKSFHAGWVFPGGQVEIGENITDAVRREVMEEAGVEIEVGELFCISSNTGKRIDIDGVTEIPTKVMLDFLCKAKGGEPRASDENSESGFFPKSRVLELMTTPAYIERFRAYLAYAGRPLYQEYVTYPAFQVKLKRYT